VGCVGASLREVSSYRLLNASPGAFDVPVDDRGEGNSQDQQDT
jgi:hypothetical protein